MDLGVGALFSFDQARELVVRGTGVYCFLFLLFRMVLCRDVGALGLADVLVIVLLIADASQNAMSGSYETVSDGFVLVGTIVGWSVLMDWVSFRFPATCAWPAARSLGAATRWRNAAPQHALRVRYQ